MGVERCEVVAPFVGDRNPPPAVVAISGVRRIVAAIFHVLPSTKFRRRSTPRGMTMFATRISCAASRFAPQTTTGTTVSGFEAVAINKPGPAGATIANGLPSRDHLLPSLRAV